MIQLCQDYDNLIREPSSDENKQKQEYSLIKKSVTQITMLEELVQIALQKMEQAAKIVRGIEQKFAAERQMTTHLQSELQQSRNTTEHLSRQQTEKVNRM